MLAGIVFELPVQSVGSCQRLVIGVVVVAVENGADVIERLWQDAFVDV